MARRPSPWFRKDRNAWFVTISGERHNLGPDKAEAFELFYQLMRQPTSKKVSPRSFASVADAFLEWTLRNRAEETYHWYRVRIQSFLDANRDMRIDSLRPYHVEQWAAVDGHSINTRRNRMRAVKRCLRWACSQGYIETNPIAHLSVPSAEGREVYICPTEFETLLSFVRTERFAELLKATYQTGCRPQEILRVEARHVDLANSRWVFPKSESKGKRTPRIIYLSEYVLELTSRLVDQHPTGKLFRNNSGGPWTTSSVGCQFTNLQCRMGKQRMRELSVRIPEAAIAKRIKTLRPCRVSGGREVAKTPAVLREEAKQKLTALEAKNHAPRYSLYAFRHSWATNALQTSGLDGLTVAVLMGHKDPSTLARTYQHLSHNPAHLLQQARRIAV
ncbi:site-specific tyrosine recombinase XerC [Posidoniimonas corsicana]|uniref:Site-specific tyrosine recombinase XerC n=1 Tax=Posidoniimonas corsicana TaxID=1938618 RepID=A0A5C5VID6_9BACT|nr:site-specific integrase [Posidoniimonas corsicana]TWT37442.1 site-specific tyrosine recombinase XerC [Posidoniimonas corsicana]